MKELQFTKVAESDKIDDAAATKAEEKAYEPPADTKAADDGKDLESKATDSGAAAPDSKDTDGKVEKAADGGKPDKAADGAADAKAADGAAAGEKAADGKDGKELLFSEKKDTDLVDAGAVPLEKKGGIHKGEADSIAQVELDAEAAKRPAEEAPAAEGDAKKAKTGASPSVWGVLPLVEHPELVVL